MYVQVCGVGIPLEKRFILFLFKILNVQYKSIKCTKSFVLYFAIFDSSEQGCWGARSMCIGKNKWRSNTKVTNNPYTFIHLSIRKEGGKRLYSPPYKTRTENRELG